MHRDMEYTRMVYKTGSFSKAAEKLYASQPTVSMAVQRVEEALGAKIFKRGTYPLRLTEAGKCYIAHTDRVAQSEAELQRDLARLAGSGSEVIRLGCLPIFTRHLIPLFLARFNAEHPDVRISVVSEFPARLKHMVCEGEIDLAVTVTAETDDAEVAYTPVLTDQILVAVPPDEPVNARLEASALYAAEVLAGRQSEQDRGHVPLSAFSDTPFVVLTQESDFYSNYSRIFDEVGFAPRVSYSASVPLSAYSMAKHGLGATLIGRLFIDEADPMLFYRLDSRVDENTYYAMSRKGDLTAGQKLLVKALRTYLDA